MANWIIRRAEAEDAAALADCIDAAYAQYVPRIADMPAVSDGIAAEIRDKLVWVAVREGEIVGGVVLVVRADHGVLANVAVDPMARGAGLGRALMDLAEAEARALGLTQLRLSTHVEMPENVRRYERLGWQETGRSGNKVMMAKGLAV
ncbi:MAG: GNAT family N-acetyltransferase [Hyphomicrobiaceae bacterium]